MILLTTALHWEAKPFIKAFSLKKDLSVTSHELFRNDEIELIVTGIGKVNAAVGTTLLCERNRDSEYVIGNIGIAGCSSHEIGSLHLIHKVTDRATKTNYYPDQLLQVSCERSSLETADTPTYGQDELLERTALADMEGAGFAQAAMRFVESSSYFIFKVISDKLEKGVLSPEQIQELIDQHAQEIMTYARSLLQLIASSATIVLSENELGILKKLTKKLQLTESESSLIEEAAVSYKVRTGNLIAIMGPYLKAEIESVEEAKRIYQEARSALTIEQ